ncbi:MAG: tyrosine-type recombinase/integrase [Elusimicrobia bacterium]|nr:tyrosine-type recombinase/integrase [Elusimicrobiota bacterium]
MKPKKQKKYFFNSENKNVDTFLWKDFCERFMNYSRFSKSAPEADMRVINAINRIIKPKWFKDLSADNIRKYIFYRKEKENLKDNSVNRDLHTIKSMWNFAVTEIFNDDIKNQASLVKDIPTEKVTKNKFFTEEEIKIILRSKSVTAIKICCYLMLYLGLRLKEACCLEWKHLLLEKNIAMIYPHKTKRSNPSPKAVPLNKNLKKFLLSLRNKTKYVIGKEFVTRRQLNYFDRIINEHLKKLKVSGTAHTCRHTFISHLIMKGVDGSIVKRWARINNEEVLQTYLHLSPKFSTEAINLLPY